MSAVAIHNMPESLLRESPKGLALKELLQRGGVVLGRDLSPDDRQAALPLGIPSIDQALPGGGLPRGQVVELALGSSSSLGTSISLAACREAQRLAVLHGGEAWCAFVDPSGSLYAPAIVQSMVSLDRLLVVQPPSDALTRVAIKLVEARAFAVIVVDLRREERTRSEREWARAVRRMALAAEHTRAVIVLLTNAATQNRSLMGLPVGMRVHLARQTTGSVLLGITKDKSGRVREPQVVAWQPDLPSKEPGLPAKSVASPAVASPAVASPAVASPAGTSTTSTPSFDTSTQRPTPATNPIVLHVGGGWKHPRNMKPKFPVLATQDGRTQLPLFGAP